MSHRPTSPDPMSRRPSSPRVRVAGASMIFKCLEMPTLADTNKANLILRRRSVGGAASHLASRSLVLLVMEGIPPLSFVAVDLRTDACHHIVYNHDVFGDSTGPHEFSTLPARHERDAHGNVKQSSRLYSIEIVIGRVWSIHFGTHAFQARSTIQTWQARWVLPSRGHYRRGRRRSVNPGDE